VSFASLRRKAFEAATLTLLASLCLPGPRPARAAVRLVSQAAAAADDRQGGAQTLVLHSDALNRNVTIDVTAPDPGKPLAPGEKAAAVYVLDRGFLLTGPSVRLLERSGAMAPAFVVAIANDDPGADRNTDFVHERLGQGAGRGAAAARPTRPSWWTS
jgi:hypothetical protein